MSEDIFKRIEALKSSLAELEDRVGGALQGRESARRYQDFVRSSTDWVWETDANLNYTFVSEGVAGVFGVPDRAMEGRYLFALNHFREIDDTLLQIVDLTQERRPFRDVELKLVSVEGDARRILISGIPAFDHENGKFIGYRGTGLDLTARARDTDVTNEGNERLAEAMEAGGVGIWDWNLLTDELYIAPRLRNVLGYREGELGGDIEAWRLRVHPADRTDLQEAIDAHLLGRTEEIEVEHRMTHRKGGIRWFRFRARATRGPSGEAVRVAGTCTDVTAQKRIELELRAATQAAQLANRAKTDFLAHLSHELRTPLNAIIGFSEAIKDGYLGPITVEKSREYATDVHSASIHLLDLINDVLDLSKVEAGEVRLNEETIVLREAIHSAIRLVEGRAATGRLRLNVEIPDNIARLRADPRLLRQVLLNLLTNAVKFTDSGGTITARARQRDDGGITLEVADTGVGIAAEDIPGALTPFTQVGEDVAEREEGTGLGLPLAKSLVELHGGTLELHSSKGTGTVVIINFPASRSIN
ncbi:MAG: PAS domain-containing protein [Rhodospirillales bacterium]|nr:PAS domain-containing protein [Rhodospirillales bacterium]